MDRKLVMTIVMPLALAAGILLSGWYMNYSMGPTVEQDASQYRAFMKQWPLPELTGHFPNALPPGAQGARMILDPGGLQGAARVELQMHLPQEAVDELLRQRWLLPTTGPATRTAAPERPRMVVQVDPQALPLVKITSAENQVVSLPEAYRLTEFFAFAEDGAWSHGRIYGTAIDRSTRHIIYFAQAW